MSHSQIHNEEYSGPERRKPFTRKDLLVLRIWMVVMSLILIIVCVYLNRTRSSNCERLSTHIQQVLLMNDQALGTPKAPGYLYYKNHPDELKLVHQTNRAFIAQFSPDHC